MPEEIPAAFRAHFARHNRRAAGLAAVSLAAAVLAWGLAYFVVCWLVLLALTISRGVDAALPRWLAGAFVLGALFLCVLTWIARRLSPFERARDRAHPLGVALDVLLAIPRMTLGVWGNLSACRHLSERELSLAWRLVRRIDQERRLSVYELPVEIPDVRIQLKVVTALQLAGLVEFQKSADAAVLALRGEAARKLAQRWVRLRLPAGNHIPESRRWPR